MTVDRASFVLVPLVHIDGFVTVPTSFNSAAKWLQCAKVTGSIRGKSDRDCCGAIAGARAASDHVTFLMPFSAQDVYFCAPSDECNDGQIDTPWACTTVIAQASSCSSKMLV